MTRKSKPNPFASRDGQLMVMAAHRYCLGRRTYIVGACCTWLRANWGLFDEQTKANIIRDTILELMDDGGGDNCDIEQWTSLARFAFDELDQDKQQWVRDAVAYKLRPWPL